MHDNYSSLLSIFSNNFATFIVGKMIGSLPELLVIIDTILLKYGNIMASAFASHLAFHSSFHTNLPAISTVNLYGALAKSPSCE